MTYYIGLLIYIFILYAVFGQCLEIKQRRWFFFFVCFGVVIFQGFRSTSVGTDLISYIPDYSAIGRQGFTQLSYMNYEVGYVLLNKILYVLGLDERGFLIAIAVIIQVPIFYTLYSYSESPIISILWYFTFGNFIMTFSGLRQGIAIAICFVAYIFIRKKKIVFFVLTVLLAATFHSSALFCMLLYPMYQIKMNQRNFTISIFIFIGMYMFRSPIFNFLSNLYYGEVKETTATGAYTMLVIYVLLYIISFFAYGGTRYASESTEIMGNAVSDDDEWEDKDFYGLRNILLLLAMVYAFAPMHNYVTRIGYPLGLYMSLYIPKLIDGFEVTPKWLYNAVCILILVGCFLSRSVGSLGTLPFSFG